MKDQDQPLLCRVLNHPGTLEEKVDMLWDGIVKATEAEGEIPPPREILDARVKFLEENIEDIEGAGPVGMPFILAFFHTAQDPKYDRTMLMLSLVYTAHLNGIDPTVKTILST